MIPDDEQQLVSRLRRDDATALEALFHRYHPTLCKISFRLVTDHERAKDVVQDVFVKLWKNRHSLEVTVSLSAYLKRAVINTSLNAIEQLKRIRNISLEEGNAVTDGRNASHTQEFSELERLAHLAIEALPIRTRAVFKLIRFEEMSYRDVATALTISEKAVEKEMMRALRLLRTALKDYLPALTVLVLLQ